MLSALVCFLALIASIALEWSSAFDPCLLCWLQRGIYALLIPFFLLAPRSLTSLLLLIGLFIAIYQSGLVYDYFEDSCPQMIRSLDFEEHLKTHRCNQSIYLFGYAAPLWNSAIFGLLLLKNRLFS